MKQKYVIALYIRLSVEDFKTESLSIPNQKLLLLEKAMSLQEWDNSEVLEFVDNGHTGTNFERPAVQELLTTARPGQTLSARRYRSSLNWCGPIRSTASSSRTFPASGATALRPAISLSECFRFTIPGLFLSATILIPPISKEIPEGLTLPLSILSVSVTAGICP